MLCFRGFYNTIETPFYLVAGGISKLIGLPFSDNSFINRMGHLPLGDPMLTSMLFNEIPENMNKKINGSETHYDIFDIEKIYWSDESITQTVFNVRHQIISNQ